jgi:hypothetical protein
MSAVGNEISLIFSTRRLGMCLKEGVRMLILARTALTKMQGLVGLALEFDPLKRRWPKRCCSVSYADIQDG